MPVVEGHSPFVGRRAELAALRAELQSVRSGAPRVVLVEGPAGIGKTALIEQLIDGETDLTVLRASGEPWEAYVAYGVVDQIVRVAGVSASPLSAERAKAFPCEEPVRIELPRMTRMRLLDELIRAPHQHQLAGGAHQSDHQAEQSCQSEGDDCHPNGRDNAARQRREDAGVVLVGNDGP